MVIAVDAAGGDFYPENPVLGAIEATKEDSAVEILLVGPENIIHKELDNASGYDASRIRILHAPEIIGMDESPATAVKSKPNSSIPVGIGAHKKGICSAFVSAGNTGALLAASTFILGKLKGVIRPTIAAVFPTIKGVRLLMDAGANLELKPEMYVQFAKMGTIFAEEILEVENPTVGFLNVGEEPEKGTDEHKEIYKLLAGSLPNFAGNIEGKDVLFAKSDIFLTDGFTGNLILKFGESVPDALKQLLAKTMKDDNISPELQKIIYELLTKTLHTFNYEHVGGIPFLGVDGISMVGHGGSSPRAIKNMILNASQCIKHKVNEKIVASLKS
ncbi:MAG: phosphate acyltransferase PlsX [Balneolaceae bacterium]